MTLAPEAVISTLWNLTFNAQQIRCVVYSGVNGMELRLESQAGVILVEPFDMEPRHAGQAFGLPNGNIR